MDSKQTKLGSSDQEASPSADKNTGVVLVSCRTWKCVPTAISRGVNISEVSGCHLLQQISSQQDHKITSRIGCSVVDLFFNSMNYGHIMKRM